MLTTPVYRVSLNQLNHINSQYISKKILYHLFIVLTLIIIHLLNLIHDKFIYVQLHSYLIQ